jgi:hypothetical protein
LSTQCIRCEAGRFKKHGAIDGPCHRCAGGQFQASKGQPKCSGCPIGKFNNWNLGMYLALHENDMMTAVIIFVSH